MMINIIGVCFKCLKKLSNWIFFLQREEMVTGYEKKGFSAEMRRQGRNLPGNKHGNKQICYHL